MKALMLFKRSDGGDQADDQRKIAFARSTLHAFGITYKALDIDALSAGAIAVLHNTYDMIVVPWHNSAYATLIDDATLKVPMFLLSSTGTLGAHWGATPGVSSIGGSSNSWFVDTPWCDSGWLAVTGKPALLSTGTSYLTIRALNSLTGSGQTNVGRTLSWSSTMAGGQRFYTSRCMEYDSPMLPWLIQAAIDEGELSAAIPRKAPYVIDVDHIQGDFTFDEPRIIDDFAGHTSHGMIWGGITNRDPELFENQTAEITGKLLDQWNKGNYKFCYHTHRSSSAEQPTTGLFPYRGGTLADQITKAEEETLYLADEVTWNAKGLVFDQPAYYNSGSHSWNEGTLALFSEDNSKASDGDDLATQSGYGFRAFRAVQQSSRRPEPQSAPQQNQHHIRQVMRGIQIFTTSDISLAADMPYDAIADWVTNTRYIGQAIIFGHTNYFHDEDFRLGADGVWQDPGVSGFQHGVMWMGTLKDMIGYLKHTAVWCANPVDYVMPRHSGGTNGVQYV